MTKTLLLLVALLVCMVASQKEKETLGKEEREKMRDEFEKWFFTQSPLSKFSSPDGPTIKTDVELPHFGTKRPESAELVPVMIIPSLIGSQLWATLHRTEVSHWYCLKDSSAYNVWYNKEEFYPLFVNCWMENVLMSYNSEERVYNNPEGVNITLLDYGGVKDVEYLDAEHTMGLWNQVIEALTNNSYVIGKNLRAAPYDWRIGADAYAPLFASLQQLIEETYSMNNNSPVALVSLSMGGPYTGLFLNSMGQSWKTKFIYSWTSFSGPFGGSSWTLPSLLGYYPGLPAWIDLNSFREMLQSFGALTWLLPFSDIFPGDLVFTPSKNYTADDFLELLNDANATIPLEALPNLKAFRAFEAPGVPTNCFFGYNVSTLATLIFPQPGFDGAWNFTVADGDGTVMTPSLDICAGWASQQPEQVNVYRVPNMQHASEVRTPVIIAEFLGLLGL